MNKIIPSLILILMISLSISPVLALSWSTTEETGDWDTIGIGGFSWDGIDPGNATYTTSIESFDEGLFINITDTIPNVYSGIYGVYSYAETWCRITIDPVNSTLNDTVVKILWRGDLYFFGLVKNYKTHVGADTVDPILVNPPFASYFPIPGMWDVSDSAIWIIPGSDLVRVYFMFQVPDQPLPLAVIFDVPTQIYEQEVNVRVDYGHQGSGHFEATLDIQDDVPEVPGYETNGHAFDWLNYLNQFLSLDFGTLASWLLTFLAVIGSLVRFALPYLGLVMIIWVIDTIVTSVMTGQVHLIGAMFITIYNFFMAIVNAISSFISMIWDFITFWS